jgi:hypothetical protein
MRPEPVEGLLGALVAAEAADRHREAVQDRDLRVEADLAKQLLAELGLDRPQVGRLADEGRAVDARESREPVAVVAAEVLVWLDPRTQW